MMSNASAAEEEQEHLDLNKEVFELAKWIIEFEFMDPRNRHMTSHQLMTLYSENIMQLLAAAREEAGREARLSELEDYRKNWHTMLRQEPHQDLNERIAELRQKEN